MRRKLLIIFVKNPALGKVKTRLATDIGDKQALRIYQLLLDKTKEITTGLPFEVIVYYSDFIDYNDIWNDDFYQKALQPEGDLGAKILYAFEKAFAKAYRSVCIIGSDCYELSTEIIKKAYALLEEKDVVIGPSVDGGYYLLGMNQLVKDFFYRKAWSTDQVFQQTVEDIRKSNLTYGLLPVLNDVDEEKDLWTLGKSGKMCQ